MKRNFLLTAALCVLVLGSFAFADPITYVYTGNAYNTFGTFAGNTGYTCTAGDPCSMDITLTLSGALGANQTEDIVTPLSFTFSDGVNTVTQSTPGIVPNGFVFATDGNGNITQWQVEVITNNDTLPEYVFGSLNWSGEVADFSSFICNCGDADYFNSNDAGTWSVETPEPPSLVLGFTGLLCLVGFGWRRRLTRADAA